MKFSELLQTTITNLVPYWSIKLLQYLGIGNEYNALITLIFNQILKYILVLNEELCITIIITVFTLIISYKLNFFNNIKIFSKSTFVLNGVEQQIQEGYECKYSDEIFALIEYLININNHKDIMQISDIKTINNNSNIKVIDNIYLDVIREISQGNNLNNNQGSRNVTFKLTSYNKNIQNIQNFLNDIVKTYRNKHFSEITLIGSEQNKTIQYPEYILAINFYILKIKNIYFPKLMCMNSYEFDGIGVCTNNGDNNNNNGNTNSSTNTKNNNDKNIAKCSFCLDNITNFKLDEEIDLSITRKNNHVYYTLKSKTIKCKDWLEKILNIYEENKNCKFKNKLVIYGSEKNNDYNNDDKNRNKIINYSTLMLALNWHVIENLGHQKYEYIEDDNLIYNYILDSIGLLQIDDDLYLQVDKEVNKRWHDNDRKHNNNQNVKYAIYSNEKNIRTSLQQYLEKFNELNKKSNKIYHFTYNGFNNNTPLFNTRLLSEKGTENELFETFDKMYSEHSDILINDINGLNDISFYRNHGLKRKKGYLFYGEPGCGKTSSVVAMALEGNRHIVEISFSLLKSNEDFEKIMSLTSINNIQINNNNIILLFDEINYGFEQITTNNSAYKKEENIDSINNLVKVMSGEEITNKKQSKLTIGTILSKLDGICNYNGLIIVATTNYIDKLEPALYREMRLTPIEFKKLRIIDCINIIKSYFNINNNDKILETIVKDRYITPAKLVLLCSTYCKSKNVDELYDLLKNEFI